MGEVEMANAKPTDAVTAVPEEIDDFDRWIEEEQRADPRLAGAIADAECRSDLLLFLINCRVGQRISQATVADAMDTTQSAVSELEGGGTDPRLSTLQRYARALGCVMRLHVESQSPVYGRIAGLRSIHMTGQGLPVGLPATTYNNGIRIREPEHAEVPAAS
jgi:transcriptional regulator with XRE-family HTH domain